MYTYGCRYIPVVIDSSMMCYTFQQDIHSSSQVWVCMDVRYIEGF